MRRTWQLVWGRVAITLLMGVAAYRLIPAATVRQAGLAAYHAWAFRHLAYSDIFALYYVHHLANHALVYWRTPIEYPVLMGVTIWLCAWAPLGLSGFFVATAVGLWVSALLIHRTLWGHNPQLANAFAFSPLLLVFGLLNWDLEGMVLMIGAITLYRRQRWSAAGIVWAAAVFFKLFPVFCLPFLAAELCHQRRHRALWHLARAFTLTALVINGPVAAVNWSNWSLFFYFNATRGTGADIWNNALWHLNSVAWADGVSLLAVGLATAAGLIGTLRGHPWERSAALVFAVFLLVNKVFSPQYMLWLWLFGALAGWSVNSLTILSVAGVADYVNSLTILNLMKSGALHATQWYSRLVFPAGLGVRYGAIFVASAGAAARVLRPIPSPHPPPPESDTTFR